MRGAVLRDAMSSTERVYHSTRSSTEVEYGLQSGAVLELPTGSGQLSPTRQLAAYAYALCISSCAYGLYAYAICGTGIAYAAICLRVSYPYGYYPAICLRVCSCPIIIPACQSACAYRHTPTRTTDTSTAIHTAVLTRRMSQYAHRSTDDTRTTIRTPVLTTGAMVLPGRLQWRQHPPMLLHTPPHPPHPICSYTHP
eukprot:998646-Rhodomonas_salina.2